MILDPQLLFLMAALLLTLAPGPDTMFVLGASLGGGARGGLLASGGIMTGLLVLLRWAGAAYLSGSACRCSRAPGESRLTRSLRRRRSRRASIGKD